MSKQEITPELVGLLDIDPYLLELVEEGGTWLLGQELKESSIPYPLKLALLAQAEAVFAQGQLNLIKTYPDLENEPDEDVKEGQEILIAQHRANSREALARGKQYEDDAFGLIAMINSL